MNDPNQGTGSPGTIDRRALPSVEIGKPSVVMSARLETLTQILSALEAEVSRLQGALEQALAVWSRSVDNRDRREHTPTKMSRSGLLTPRVNHAAC
jgi:hypothetical protein